jgi:hypothetical protein
LFDQQATTFNLKRHISRYHQEIHKEVEKNDKVEGNFRLKRLGKTPADLGNALSQRKMTDFITISPVMQLAVNLAVRKGLSFSTFDSKDMRKLLVMAKKGASDSSKLVVNSENVKKSLKETAKIKKDEIRNKLKGRVLSITADFATCERRSFLGKFSKFQQ